MQCYALTDLDCLKMFKEDDSAYINPFPDDWVKLTR